MEFKMDIWQNSKTSQENKTFLDHGNEFFSNDTQKSIKRNKDRKPKWKQYPKF
jgi:hypothetical protein